MKKRVFRGVLLLAALSVFVYSGYMIFSYWREGHNSRQAVEDLVERAVVIRQTEPTAGGSFSEENGEAETEPERILETAPIQVDFEVLRQESGDVVAWIYCPDTIINYPIVQGADNEFYLRKLINGEYNYGGSIFLDCRNRGDFSDWNSIIYGHNMRNNTMFAPLVNYEEQAYYEEHPVMYLLTPEKDFKIELVAGCLAEADENVYALAVNQESKETLCRYLMERSTFSSPVQPQPEDRLLMLSTCSYEYDDARYVVMGVMRELDRE